MSSRKHHYTASQVAAMTGSDVNVVYTALKEGKIKGHKCRSGKWLIPKEQVATFASLSLLSGKERPQAVVESENESFIRYIADEEHYTEVFTRMNTVKYSLKLATGDLKNFNVHFSAEPDTEPVRFGEFIQMLLNRGINIQIVCMKPFRFCDWCNENIPDLLGNPNLEIRQCDHNHIKAFIFDDECAYIGSANITGAAIGRRKNKARNHEAGILTQNNDLFRDAASHFDRVWNDPDNLKHTWHRFRNKANERKNDHDIERD